MIDWTFHIGSCALKAWPFYLWSFQIFSTMQERPSDFMIWTGDHVYMLKPWQWQSKESMRKAYLNQRKTKRLKNYMDSRPQYAVWDDHDFGPNNAGADFFNKDTAQAVFREMWPHQNYAGREGVYHTFSHHEAQFFMLDGRYFKIPDTQLLGPTQYGWLCEELKKSKASFKFICIGIQVLCDGEFENFRGYKTEYGNLMKFLSDQKIEGVIFMTGDVHFAEVSREIRSNDYPLYDFSFSALTSFPVNFITSNTYRIDDSKRNVNNFGEVSFTGEQGNRICTLSCRNRHGKELWSYQINENDLKYKK